MLTRKNLIKNIFLSIFKAFVYLILYLQFILIFSRINYALLSITRTFIITSSAFFVSIFMMIPIYGNFDIEKEKTKPVFVSTMITILFTDVLAFFTLLIMGIKEFPIQEIVLTGILSLLILYILQGVFIWISAHIGNDLYFKIKKPSPTIIIENDEFMLKKIKHYVTSYDKQYDLIEIYKKPSFESISFEGIESIFLLGAKSDFEKKVAEYCFKHNISLTYNSDTTDLLLASNSTSIIDDLLVIEINPKYFSLTQMFFKRLMDIVGSLLFIFVFSPIFVIIALFIKLEDGGPVIFKQDRYTTHGRIFKIYKFRSMKVDAEDFPAQDDDHRITKVGKIIRKLRVDEIPQMFNILKGDMSLVGPRAESVARVTDIKKEFPDFDLRLRVKAGLTGYAQIFGKYNTSPQMKLLLDIKYIENFSILEDIKLLFQTVIVFVKSDSTEGFNEDNVI